MLWRFGGEVGGGVFATGALVATSRFDYLTLF